MKYKIYDFTKDKLIPSNKEVYIRYASYVKLYIEEEHDELRFSSFVYVYEDDGIKPDKILLYEEFLGFYIEQNKLEEKLKWG